jgi:hypothetical protein
MYLAPTSSTLLTLALLGAIAVAAMNQARLVTTSLNPFNREAVIQ